MSVMGKHDNRPGGPKDRDRHLPHKMVRVPVAVHRALKDVAKRHRRPITGELEVAIREYVERHGVEVVEEPEE